MGSQASKGGVAVEANAADAATVKTNGQVCKTLSHLWTTRHTLHRNN